MKAVTPLLRWMLVSSLLLLMSIFSTARAGFESSPLPPFPERATKRDISLDFRKATVIEMVRLLSETAKINIVATEKASNLTVTVFLHRVSVREALDAIAKTAGLWYRYDENSGVYRVMTAEEYQNDIVLFSREETRVLVLRNANVLAAANSISALFGERVSLAAPQQETQIFSVSGLSGGQQLSSQPLGGAQADAQAGASVGTGSGTQSGQSTRQGELSSTQIAELLEKVAAGNERTLANLAVAPPPIRVTYNLQHNMLILRSSDTQALDEAERLVKAVDHPIRQVLLEMKVLQVTLGDDFRSAFDFAMKSSSTTVIGDDEGNSIEVPKLQIGTGNFPTEGGTLVFEFLDNRISARLQALASENRVKVLSTPLLLASNQQPAELFIGEERVLVTNVVSDTVTNQNQTVTTFTSETEKRNIGNTLSILPRINADRTVSLSIVQDASRLLPKSAVIPVGTDGKIQEFPIDTVNTSRLKVNVIAKDRLTVAVGGMMQEEDSMAESKVPLLGDIPGLGNLFKRKEKNKTMTELVLVITPYILDSPEEGELRSYERVRTNSGLDKPGIEQYLAPGAAPIKPN